jgi:Na+-transporting NADH:ubiquinone oxidoreductase subunit NqrE
MNLLLVMMLMMSLMFLQAGKRNVQVIDDGASLGVRSYIFAPCIVYGKGEGFGNPISIQTVAVIRAAKKMRRVYTVDDSSAVRFIYPPFS